MLFNSLIYLFSHNSSETDVWLQIRDLTVYIEAQKTLNDMTDSDGIKGGTVLPVPSEQSSRASGKKQTKSGRRRS